MFLTRHKPFMFETILVKNTVNNDKNDQDGPKFEWSVTYDQQKTNRIWQFNQNEDQIIVKYSVFENLGGPKKYSIRFFFTVLVMKQLIQT